MSATSRQQKLDALDARRSTTVRNWLAQLQRDQAARLQETRSLFGEPVVVIDPHTHSEFSDGRATVAANRDAGTAAGIDLVFATDHASLGQKRAIRNMPGMSWGQEPGAGPHHLGLLCNRRLFRPRLDSLAADVARARKLAPFVWIPHPAGWYPRTEYSADQMQTLWALAPAFAMEVINGAARIGTAFDRFDAAAVELWDRLLLDGIRVTPLGGSDAHVPEGIGTCWTAVPGAAATAEAVIAGLNAGCCLASEAPLVRIHLDGQPMGAAVRPAQGRRRMTLRYRVADAAGLQCVRIVADGRVRKTLYPRAAACVDGEWPLASSVKRYVRVEARAVDNRRAFSAPIYLDR